MSEDDDFISKFRRRRPTHPGLPSKDLSRDFALMMRDFERLLRSGFKNMDKDIQKKLIREKIMQDGSRKREVSPFVYRYSVTIGPEGKPRIRKFGNLKAKGKGRDGTSIIGEREPLIDIIEVEKEIKVIAEVPGVDKEKVKLGATDSSLEISVESPRMYSRILNLPSKIIPETAKATYKNGILEVRLKKKDMFESHGKSIEIQ